MKSATDSLGQYNPYKMNIHLLVGSKRVSPIGAHQTHPATIIKRPATTLSLGSKAVPTDAKIKSHMPDHRPPMMSGLRRPKCSISKEVSIAIASRFRRAHGVDLCTMSADRADEQV